MRQSGRWEIFQLLAILLNCHLWMAGAAAGQPPPLAPGDTLPALKGKLLSGREISLPGSTRGSAILMLLGFTYQSRHDVEAWAERFRHDFAADSGIRCYEIPVIGGAAHLARPFIDRGMRRGTPRELQDRVITLYGESNLWKRRVGFSAPNVAYVLLVDRAGRLAWRARGPFDDGAFRELVARIRQLRHEESSGSLPDAALDHLHAGPAPSRRTAPPATRGDSSSRARTPR